MVGARKRREITEDEKALRTSAEDHLSRIPDTSQELDQKTQIEIIHELQVHQIELEIQNEELKRAHLELELSRDRYQNLYDFAPIGYCTLTNTALIKEVNLSGATLLGVVRQKLIGARFRSFVSSKQHDIWDPFFLHLLGQDKKQICMLLLKKGDGTNFDARIEGARVKTDEGGFLVRIIIQDISDQKAAEEEIRILAQIADNAPASITVHDFDGTYLYANEETFRLHGSSREEFFAMNLADIDGPEHKKEVDEHVQKLQESGVVEFEVYHTRKDGSSFPLLVHAKIVPWYGRPVILSIATDLSEQKRGEKIRIESEERFRGLIRDIPDSILVLRNGTILYVNPAAASTMKYTPEEMIGSSVLNFVAPESYPLVAVKMQERENGKEVPPFEITVLTKDGKPKITIVRGTPIQYEGETASLVVLNDITEKKQVEEAFLEAVQKLRFLTGLTRHDILNQLTAVQLLHDLALESKDLAKIHEYISRAKNAGDQIEATIGFTREYENFGTAQSRWHRIHPLIEYIQNEVSTGTITIQNLIPEKLEIYADPIIRKVFTTLVENSIRHGGEVSTFRFSCKKLGDALIIICEDDGVGIPSGEKEDIFENGYGKHTGIGLFLAREILSITGMTIRECGIEGEKAIFEITVPAGRFRRLA
ncbi:MAG: PAS domain S-box protein [Methanobacteriota archaeon]